MTFTALVLAGGGSRRFATAGTGVDKLALDRDGRTLLAEVVDGAYAAGADQVIVVGHHQDALPADVAWTREDPEGGGPLAGLAAGMTHCSNEIVVVLAGDAPRGPRAIPALIAALESCSSDTALLVDDASRLQMLCGAYRADVIRRVLGGLNTDLQGAPMRLLADRLTVTRVTDVWSASLDVDTPEDAEREGYA